MDIKKITNPVLYSTMTELAFNVNSQFYGGRHYLWCTPYFGSNYQSPHFTVPPSSSPLEIYTTLKNEIVGSDRHANKIPLNRVGIKRGAEAMRARGLITDVDLQDIIQISDLAQPQQFRPLLCVIPRENAIASYKKVEVKDKANPLSYECIVSDLPQSAFDIIRLD